MYLAVIYDAMQRGWSALMWACQAKGKKEEAKASRRKIANYLLAAGADVNSEADVIIIGVDFTL